MKTITLGLKERSYKIIVGTKLIAALGAHLKRLAIGEEAFIITNSLIKRTLGRKLEAALRSQGFSFSYSLVADTEKSKSLETAYSVIRAIARCSKKKKIFVIAFGGGVIGDLAGFISSVYRRSIPYVNIPTTLLAQVDSSIGGKTGVDLPEAKNLVGSFYQPKAVFSDIDVLATLPKRQLISGLAEVIKYAIIKDPALFSYLEKHLNRILHADKKSLEYIVCRCAAIKAKIVSLDEREEKGIRTILNFGHTIGHAIEAAAGYKGYNHGEAIALGMLVASEISQELHLISQEKTDAIKKLIAHAGLPTSIRRLSLEAVIKAHYHDKKFSGKKNKFVLICDIGKTKIVENIPLSVIKGCLKKRFAEGRNTAGK